LLVNVVLWPGYISKLVGLSYSEVVWKVWAPVYLSSVPFAIATYAVNARFPAHNLIIFFLQTTAVLPVFIVSIGLVFRSYVTSQIFPKLKYAMLGRK
jgi:hypothetical protein